MFDFDNAKRHNSLNLTKIKLVNGKLWNIQLVGDIRIDLSKIITVTDITTSDKRGYESSFGITFGDELGTIHGEVFSSEYTGRPRFENYSIKPLHKFAVALWEKFVEEQKEFIVRPTYEMVEAETYLEDDNVL